MAGELAMTCMTNRHGGMTDGWGASARTLARLAAASRSLRLLGRRISLLGEGLGGWLIDLIACGAGYCELRIDVRGRAHLVERTTTTKDGLR